MASGSGGNSPKVGVQSVSCPNCGATVAVRSFGHAVNVVCQSCHSILDAKDAGVRILQQFKDAVTFDPLIPLGARGKVSGELYEAIGFQVRQIKADDTLYRWSEYLLFNPYKGFRYLTEYNGHWNFVSPLQTLPDGDPTPGSETPRSYQGQRFRHFQTARATTVFVLGEFPWQVRVGESVTVADYVSPPRMLSGEVTSDNDATWSLGEYVTGADIWKGLALAGQPPAAQGVYANQPSPFTGVTTTIWRRAILLVILAGLVWVAQMILARQKEAFAQNFVFDARSGNDSSLVTEPFELDGAPSTVSVETMANIDNQWMYVGYALINEETGQTFDFGREVSYYHGYEGGESWTEGSKADSVMLPRVPPGRYFLRIEPEGDRVSKPIAYRVRVVRDVPTSIWFLIAVGLLALPPIGTTWRSMAFERRRWAESDHAPSSSSDSDRDDDD
jgi:uncharacterized protein DUF4178